MKKTIGIFSVLTLLLVGAAFGLTAYNDNWKENTPFYDQEIYNGNATEVYVVGASQLFFCQNPDINIFKDFSYTYGIVHFKVTKGDSKKFKIFCYDAFSQKETIYVHILSK